MKTNIKNKKLLKLVKGAFRRGWGAISPVTRIVPSGKLYDRKANKLYLGD